MLAADWLLILSWMSWDQPTQMLALRWCEVWGYLGGRGSTEGHELALIITITIQKFTLEILFGLKQSDELLNQTKQVLLSHMYLEIIRCLAPTTIYNLTIS